MAEPRVVFDFELQKSMNTAGLVQQQVTVHANGKTFTRMQWVNPNQAAQVNSVAFNLAEFERLKPNKADALKYLKDCGITWKEDAHEGVNWMRASMAAKKGNAGAAPVAQNAKKNPLAGKPSPTGTKQQKTQNTTGLDFKKLATQGYDKVSGSVRVKMLKTQMSKDEFMAVARSLVSWDEHTHDGINMMRASMAMTDWANGASLADLSQSVAGKALDKEVVDLAENAIAPVEKPKKSKQEQKKEQKKADSQIPIPENASPREKRMIEMVNAIKTMEDLDTCKSVGMLAADEAAMKYLRHTLLPKAAEQKQSTGTTNRGVWGNGYYNDALCNAMDKTMKTMSKRVLKAGVLDSQRDTLNAVQFTSPRSLLQITGSYGDDTYKSELTIYTGDRYNRSGDGTTNIEQLFGDMLLNFSTYKPTGTILRDSYYDDSKGKFGYDSSQPQKGISTRTISIRKSNFNPDRDGFLRVLNLIADGDPELKTATWNMGQQYKQLLELTGYDPSENLRYIMERDDELKSRIEHRKGEITVTKEVKAALKKVLPAGDYERVVAKVTGSSYGSDRINLRNQPQTLKVDNPDYGAATGNYDVPRYKEVTFDLSGAKASNGEYLVDVVSNNGSDGRYVRLLSDEDVQWLQEDLDAGIYTPENRDKVLKLLTEMFGVELRTDGRDRWNSDKKYLKPNGDNEKLDAILSNMLRLKDMCAVRNKTHEALARRHTPSAANGKGNNLENVFDIISTSSLSMNHLNEYTIYGYGDKKYDTNEIVDKLAAQTENMPIASLATCKKLRKDLIAYNEDRADKIPSSYKGFKDSQGNVIYAPRYDLIGGPETGTHVWYNTSDGNQQNTPSSHPLCDLLVENMFDIAVHSPSIRTTRVKTDDDVRGVLLRNLGLAASQSDEEGDGNITREIRKQALSNIKCSLSTVPDDEYKTLQHRIKMDWDQKVHGGNSAVFFGAYKIENLAVREKLEKAAAEIGETPQEYYHGTSFGGTKGILGTTGGFSVNKEVQSAAGASRAGSMLGEGVYLAKKSSKSAQYFGGYNYGRYGRGTLFICDAIMGKKLPYRRADGTGYMYSGALTNEPYDTVEASEATNSRGSLCNDEWAVRHADWVVPKYLIDMENARRQP